MARDMAAISNLNEFGEEGTYVQSGISKAVSVMVNRQRISPANEDSGRTLVGQMEVSIPNSEDLGMASVIKGQDRLFIPETIGGPDVEYLVIDILSQDEGMWHLLLQK